MKREWMERLGFLILAALVWIPAVRWEQQRSQPDHTAWEEAVARAREEVAQGAAALQKAQEAAAQRTAPEVVGESAPDLPSNDAPKWVETRYVGFGNEGDSATPEEQGTLYLPRILLNSPDGTAVNRLIQTWYEENQGDTKGSGQTDALEADGLPIWDPMWDHVWYAANTWDGMLSVGILCRNVFGSVHVQGGWTFDLDHGTLLDNQEVLARVGISQFVQAVRQELRAMVTQEWDAIAQRSAQPGDVIAEHAEENRDRLLAEIQSGQHDPEDPAVFVTGDGAVCLSVWNPSQEYYYDGGDEDWTTLITLHAASTLQNAG